MKQNRHWFFAVMVTLMTGCTTPSWHNVPALAIPVEPTYDEQIELFQLNQELRRKDIDSNARMQLLYERGLMLERFGLTTLSQSDFLRILRIRPDIPEVYNQLGGYAVQIGELDSAYLAFDSALELDPEYSLSYLNRGIALYNGERYQLAAEDFRAFFENNAEPIVLLWIYLAEQKIDVKMAQQNLRANYESLQDKNIWGTDIVRFYLGMINERTLIDLAQKEVTDNKTLAEHLSEVYFYLGKHYLNKGDEKSAMTLFKLTLANNIRYFIEYRQALLEIEKLGQNKPTVPLEANP